MATRKQAPAKKTAPAKKAVATKKAPATKVSKGDKLVCEVCGLSVIVDEFNNTVGVSEIICCEMPMKPKAVKTRAAKKATAKTTKK